MKNNLLPPLLPRVPHRWLEQRAKTQPPNTGDVASTAAGSTVNVESVVVVVVFVVIAAFDPSAFAAAKQSNSAQEESSSIIFNTC